MSTEIVQKYIFPEIILPQYRSNRVYLEDPFSENVQDMKENNISKYYFDPMVEGGVIAIRVSVINMSSL